MRKPLKEYAGELRLSWTTITVGHSFSAGCDIWHSVDFPYVYVTDYNIAWEPSKSVGEMVLDDGLLSLIFRKDGYSLTAIMEVPNIDVIREFNLYCLTELTSRQEKFN